MLMRQSAVGRDNCIRHGAWFREAVHEVVEARVHEQRDAGKERLSLRITVIEDLNGLSLLQLSSATVSLYSELMRLDQGRLREA